MLLGTQSVNAQGHLEIGGCDTVELAKEFGTPLYVIDEATIRANCRNYKAAFDKRYPQNRIYYASKAFLTLATARIVMQEGLNMDVASMGELYVALQAGCPPERLAMHGNNIDHRDEASVSSAYSTRMKLSNLARCVGSVSSNAIPRRCVITPRRASSLQILCFQRVASVTDVNLEIRFAMSIEAPLRNSASAATHGKRIGSGFGS